MEVLPTHKHYEHIVFAKYFELDQTISDVATTTATKLAINTILQLFRLLLNQDGYQRMVAFLSASQTSIYIRYLPQPILIINGDLIGVKRRIKPLRCVVATPESIYQLCETDTVLRTKDLYLQVKELQSKKQALVQTLTIKTYAVLRM